MMQSWADAQTDIARIRSTDSGNGIFVAIRIPKRVAAIEDDPSGMPSVCPSRAPAGPLSPLSITIDHPHQVFHDK